MKEKKTVSEKLFHAKSVCVIQIPFLFKINLKI